MVIKSREHSLSAWIFLVGILLAIIAGVFARGSTNPIILVVIVLIGLIVGYFVPEKEVQTFLFASVAAVLASFAGVQGLATNVSLTGVTVTGLTVGRLLASVLGTMLFLFVPATIMVAIKTVFSIAKI